jgi:aromatic ring-opening dioxygenase LigB subunit
VVHGRPLGTAGARCGRQPGTRPSDLGARPCGSRQLARAAEESPRRIALIASADHGHAHDSDGPYGFDPAAASYDEILVRLVRENRLSGLLELDPALVEAAKADSWWQLAMLHGALQDGWRGDFLSYEASTYFGMLCAAYVPN